MLSKAAWNAFLKTLEEPPPHVKFIFATTEVHKVPITILSPLPALRLQADPDADDRARASSTCSRRRASRPTPPPCRSLAREAAGSMRDAMSLLDQVIAVQRPRSSTGERRRARPRRGRSRRCCTSWRRRSSRATRRRASRVVERLAQQGFDLPHVARDILQHLRNLVVGQGVSGPPASRGRRSASCSTWPTRRSATSSRSPSRAEVDDLSRLFQGFSRAFDEIVKSGQPRTALEMALVRLARRPPLLPLDELLARLGDLERRLGGGAPARARAPWRGRRRRRTRRRRRSIALHAVESHCRRRRSRADARLARPRRSGSRSAARAPRARPQPRRSLRRGRPPPAPREPRLHAAPPPSPRARAASARARHARGATRRPCPRPPPEPRRTWRRGARVIARLRETQAPVRVVLRARAAPRGHGRARGRRVRCERERSRRSARGEPEALEALTRAVRAHFGAPTQVVLELAAKAAAGRAHGGLARGRAANAGARGGARRGRGPPARPGGDPPLRSRAPRRQAAGRRRIG